jgi:hypothetical protein
MNTEDIIVNLTEAEHELMIDLFVHALDSYQFVAPYDSGVHDLPLDNPIIQRYDMIQNLRERFLVLWQDRFENKNEIL